MSGLIPPPPSLLKTRIVTPTVHLQADQNQLTGFGSEGLSAVEYQDQGLYSAIEADCHDYVFSNSLLFEEALKRGEVDGV